MSYRREESKVGGVTGRFTRVFDGPWSLDAGEIFDGGVLTGILDCGVAEFGTLLLPRGPKICKSDFAAPNGVGCMLEKSLNDGCGGNDVEKESNGKFGGLCAPGDVLET